MVVLGTYDRLRASKIEGRVPNPIKTLLMSGGLGDLIFLPKNRLSLIYWQQQTTTYFLERKSFKRK